MAHYALLDENNIVLQVITGRDENEIVDGISDWEAYYSQETGLKAVRTSYNTFGGVHYDQETREPSADQSKAFRYNYAGIGHSYDPNVDAFVAPQPYDSWVLNEAKMVWEPPTPMPTDGQPYGWNDATQSWDIVGI